MLFKKRAKTKNPSRTYRNTFRAKPKKKLSFFRSAKKTRVFTPRYSLKKQKKGNFLKKFLIVILILSICAYGIYVFFFSQFFNIKSIKYNLENSEIEEADINPYLKDILGSGLISLKPIKYKEKIISNFPQIEKIEIKKIFPQTIGIKIETYPIFANIINRQDNIETKFLINKGGYLVSKDLENPNIPYIIVNSEKPFEVKVKLISQDRLQKILDSMKLYEDFFNMKVYDAKYLPREREVHLNTEKNFSVWIDLEGNIEKQLKKLKKGLKELNIYETPLQYIDLRITGKNSEKIFYMPK
ncbi:MAG: hypothetical protein UR27_C0011G0036 [Candidatus Peregrinibacteria bacterium GW2011_GWA2_33_10]|nr:MAG: hypothetical protein UR27_C0011G0036 [Candidatus Peregrinibacteria bacterium GW2011_GWA2_33_10]KKP38897.1 MAG: hypothetical protein UR30_C0014G0035 [Candidatus Peregrinibacteria bacterium GW2011_GWC2_33_13]